MSANENDRLRFGVLGPLRAWDGERMLDLGAPQQQAVLAMLVVHAGQVVSREEVMDGVWGDGIPPSVVNVVQSYVARLRRVLEPDRPIRATPHVLVTSGDGYVLRVRIHQVDLGMFEEHGAAAQSARDAGNLGAAAVELSRAMELWQGAPLAGIPGPFAEIQRVRLTEMRLVTLETRLELDLELGRHNDVVAELTALVAENPLRDRLRAQLMLALYRSGRQADALAVYDHGRRVQAAELGIEPGPHLQELRQAILKNAAEIAAPRHPAVTTARADPPPRPAHLPHDVPDFTGRDEIAARLHALLGRDAARDAQAVPVTVITGQAGVGKTALAVHVAHRLRPWFSDGQLFIDLRGAGPDPAGAAEVLSGFLRALGVDGSGIPDALEERAALYRSRVADKKLLIVLDNAASEAQVRPLIPGAPSCGVLITSRRRLAALAAAFTVDLEVFGVEEAIRLLEPFAGPQRIADDPQGTRKIAQLCGCLPLALRIAGARLAANRHWSLARLAGRLSDEKHRLDELVVSDLDVRASVLLTYRMLAAEEQRAFRMLGLLDAPDFADWVIAALLEIPPERAEQVADALVGAQLLETTGPGATPASRYRFHDLVQLVARERADDEEPGAARRAAVERAFAAWLWCSDAAVDALPSHAVGAIRGPARRHPVGLQAVARAKNALAWFQAEHGALAATVRQAAHNGMAGVAWELAASLTDYFARQARYDDWRATHAHSLHACRRAGDLLGEAVTLRGLAEMATMVGEFSACMDYATDALRVFRDLGEHTGEVDTLVLRATAHYEQGRHGEQEVCADTALTLARRAGYLFGEANALLNLSLLWIVRRDLDRAAAYCELFRDRAHEIGDRHLCGMAGMSLGVVRRDQGNLDEAAACLTAALAEFRQIGHVVSEAWAEVNLASILTLQRHPGARAAAGRAYGLFTDLCAPDGQALAQRLLGVADLADGLLAQAIDRLEDATRIERTIGGKYNLARTLRELGRAYDAAGKPSAAHAAWTEAHHLFTELANPQAAEIAAMLDNRPRAIPSGPPVGQHRT
jgi:DNA-binding SARP family transcriptional activator/tetratricopeptide (TPR) repeat protein